MKRNTQWQLLVLAAGLILSVKASAQEVGKTINNGPFGSMGQLVISDDLWGSIGYTSVSGPGDEFFINLNPAADYFLKENLSLGGFVTLQTGFRDGPDPLTVGLGVRGGYNIPMSGQVSLWPRLGLAVLHNSDADYTFLEVSITAPFLVHVAPHFFIGGGPGLITDIGDDTSATLQVSTLIGGYF